ncbi:hypothetical protein SAMN02745181_0886 [Rubritalea squalenifaciens DSM 18772]|uniref:AEC family transporter n=2 Tax=Rubritalea TaxID=361050 RepID=A0A1M6DZV1_9BACT|nr:AEC family transporter [Rubritalea squalenifaciens]SHI78679.1 hypothetical protein SAMN02745181_0886 [Rubritalea squalenifaciens DSM 18772]
MEHVWTVLQAAFPVYCIIGLGILLRKLKVLTEEMDKGLMLLVVHLLLPSLILVNIVGNEALMDVGLVAWAAGLGFVFVAGGFLVGYLSGGLLGLKKGGGKRTFAVSTGIQNYGYMAIPLMAALFPGGNGLGVLLTHNVGVELALWTVGIAMLTGELKPSLKMFLKGPIVAVVVALSVNWLGVSGSIPGSVTNVFTMLGNCAVPIALLTVGTTIYDLMQKASFDWRVSLGGTVVRLFVIPAMMIGAVAMLPVTLELKQVIIVQAAMPAAVFPIILARHYGGRPDVAVQVSVATNVLCVITMPLVVAAGIHFVL